MWELFHFKIRILPFLIGFLTVFFGWILYWFGINITGAVLGGTVGVTVGGLSAVVFGQNLFFPLVTILGLIGVIFGIFLIRTIHGVVFFFSGLIVGALILGAVMEALVNSGMTTAPILFVNIAVRAAGGITGGFLLWKFNRYIISVLTSFAGTFIMMGSWNFRGGLLMGAVFFLAGLVFQIIVLGKKRPARLLQKQ